MGGIVDAIFGGGDDVETTVTHEYPPELRQLYRTIVEEIQALRPLVEQAVPDVQKAIQQYIQQYQDWLERSPEFFEQARQQLGGIASQTEKQLHELFFGSGEVGSKKGARLQGREKSDVVKDIRERVNQVSGLGELIAERFKKDPNAPSDLRVLMSVDDNALTKLGELIAERFQRDPNAPSDLRVLTPDEASPIRLRGIGKLIAERFQRDPNAPSDLRVLMPVDDVSSEEVPTQGIMNLLDQYIQQAQERAGRAWEEAIGRASGFWDEAIGKAGSYWEEAIGRAGGYWDEARRTLLQDIQEAERKLPQIYEQARKQTKDLTQEVLQDALRNTIRKMALQGLISQTAGTQAMAEQFRQYEYEPLQRLTEAEAEAKRRLEETALGYKTDVAEKKAGTLSGLAGQKAGTLSSLAGQKAGTLSGLVGQKAGTVSSLISQGLGAREAFLRDYVSNVAKTLGSSMALQSGLTEQQLGFQLSLPEIYKAIMQAQQQYTLTPVELRRMLIGTLTGSVGPLQQLAPANVTQTTSGGINPILGGLIGTAGTLGLFKLFGII